MVKMVAALQYIAPYVSRFLHVVDIYRNRAMDRQEELHCSSELQWMQQKSTGSCSVRVRYKSLFAL